MILILKDLIKNIILKTL